MSLFSFTPIMSQISADSYSYNGGMNDLSSVHSGNSYTGASDEFRYDATDMLYAWELSGRFNHHVHRGAKLDDLHLISAAPITSSLGKAASASASASASHAGDNYLLENPFDHSTINFEDFPIKMNPSSSYPVNTSSNHHPKRKYVAESSSITDEFLEQFQKGIYLSNDKPPTAPPTTADDYHSQNQFYQFLSNYHHQEGNNNKRLECPDRPFHLMKTHINLTLSSDDEVVIDCQGFSSNPVECIINMVTCYLSTYSEYDFSYFPKLFMWKGKFLQGSSSCLINIHLYKEKFLNNSFIIEANRISGEAKPFHEFFKSFKQLLLSNLPSLSNDSENDNNNDLSQNTLQRSESSGSSSFDYYDEESSPCFCTAALSSDVIGGTGMNTSGPNSPLKKIDCRDFQKSIEPILNMSKCLFYEVKLEAAKMLCDISSCDDIYLRDNKCIDNIFKAIENLILHNDGFLAVKEQAIVAFASFIETNQREVLNRMLKSQVLHILLQLINNPVNETSSYETAQMRRESARVMSILASFDAKGLLQSLEAQQISAHALKRWFDNIDTIRDQRTRIYAIRIREHLTNAQEK